MTMLGAALSPSEREVPMMNNYIDKLALSAAHAIEDEFAKGHPGGATQRKAAIQNIVIDTISKALGHATDRGNFSQRVKPMADKYLIWWTSQEDCEAIAPLDSWPVWLYDEFRSRHGRPGRGRLWCPRLFASDAPEEAKWSSDNWLCAAAESKSAGGIVIPSFALRHVQFLPGFVTTFDMALPEAE